MRNEVLRGDVNISGSEMQTLILIFSMIAGDLVPKDDEIWTLYLSLREIMDIVLSRTLQKGYVGILRELVTDHLKLFKKLFPEERITPKGHNFSHYATALLESGPIVDFSTIRYEGYHLLKKERLPRLPLVQI